MQENQIICATGQDKNLWGRFYKLSYYFILCEISYSGQY